MANFNPHNISSIKLYDVVYNIKSIPFFGTEAEWNQSDYIPKAGEIIIYDKDQDHDYFRIKIGNGSSLAASLEFYNHLVNINDVFQNSGDVLILDCGDSNISIAN